MFDCIRTWLLGWGPRAEEGTHEGRPYGMVWGAADCTRARSIFELAEFGFDLGVRDGVGEREVGQPLGQYGEVFRVFQVIH